MKDGSTFERDGRRYEVLQDGLSFIQGQKSCVRPNGGNRSITIERALKLRLIREITQVQDLTSARSEDGRLPLEYTDEKDHEAIPPRPGTGTAAVTYASSAVRPLSDNGYYMPVDHIKAQVFLAHGLIYPVQYDKAGVSTEFDDIQERENTNLTLFTTPRRVRKNQLLLRILLNSEEVAISSHRGDALRLAMPLPISRLVGIEVPPEAGDLDRYVDGWVKPDVPVPRHLFATAQGGSPEISEDGLPESAQSSEKQTRDIEYSIRRFDRYMGLMAYLRNTARYFSAGTGSYADFPEAFFSLCSAILRDPEVRRTQESGPDQLLMALLDQEAHLTTAAKAIQVLVTAPEAYIEKERARSTAVEIYKTAGDDEDLGQAFKNLFAGDYRSAMRVLQSTQFPREAGLLAALYKFSGRQSNDHRTVKQRLHEDWSIPQQVVPLLGALGAYYGYTALDARETRIYSVHPLFVPLIEERPEIKFHLRTLFERQVIEAIYQWAFFRRPSGRLLEDLYAKIPASAALPTPANLPRMLVRDHSYQVRDQFVRRYEVTMIGRIIQRLRDIKGDSIDERSETGKVLVQHCFFLADEFELSRKGGRETLHYRISKHRLLDLLTHGQISVNARVLETAMDEDEKNSNI